MRSATALAHHALNLLFPPQCLLCDALVQAHGTLCGTCWNGITFLGDPACAACGLPFQYAMDGAALCEVCRKDLPPFAQARAVFAYDGASRGLIKKLKYHDQTLLAAIFGPWMAKAARPFAAECQLVIPVPLHWRRFIGRRYNQAALLAAAVAKEGGLTWLPDGLTRLRPTPTQTGLSRSQREQNVVGAFAVPPRHAARLRNARVLLVDDVYTTGATLRACTQALLSAGVGRVYVVTLARRC